MRADDSCLIGSVRLTEEEHLVKGRHSRLCGVADNLVTGAKSCPEYVAERRMCIAGVKSVDMDKGGL